MSFNLDSGFISYIYNTRDTSRYSVPTVQLLDVKQLPHNPATQKERFRLMVSDGTHYMTGMFVPGDLINLIHNNAIKQNCIIQCNDYTCNEAQGKVVLIIKKLTVVQSDCNGVVGTPSDIVNNTSFLNRTNSSMSNNNSNSSSSVDSNNNKENMLQQQNTFIKQENNNFSNNTYNQQQNSNNSYTSYNPIIKQQQSAQGSSPIVKLDPSHANEQSLTPINQLNPYQNKWAIKARVTAKSDMKEWTNARGNGKLFSVDLLDISGGQIRATMFKDAADKFYSILEQDKVYIISKGQLKLANKKFSRLPNEYEITLNSDAEIIEVHDDSKISTQKFDFKEIHSINNIQPNEFVDVIGLVTSVSDITSVNSQKTQRELKKRTVTIVDHTMSSIECTLWNDFADKFDSNIVDHIIAIKQVRVSDFGGRSIGTTFQSQIFIDVDHQMSGTIKSVIQRAGSNPEYTQLTKGKNVSEPGSISSNNSYNQRKPLSAIENERLGMGNKPDYITSRAAVVLFKAPDFYRPPFYLACSSDNCNKKVTDAGNGMFRCEKCDIERSHYIPRYVLSCLIGDYSNVQWISLFDNEASKLLNITASELEIVIRKGDRNVYDNIFKSAVFNEYVIRYRCKAEYQQDEQRLRCQATQLDTIDYVKESQLLIQEIDNYV